MSSGFCSQRAQNVKCNLLEAAVRDSLERVITNEQGTHLWDTGGCDICAAEKYAYGLFDIYLAIKTSSHLTWNVKDTL